MGKNRKNESGLSIRNIFNSFKRIIRLPSFVIFSLLSAIFVTLILLPHKNPLIVIEGKTRGLDYVVTNRVEGRIQFTMPVQLHIPDSENKDCIAGLFEPKDSTQVTYSLNKDTLVIRIENENNELAGSLTPQTSGGKSISLPHQTTLSYGKSNKCLVKEYEPIRLPIWGPTNIGTLPITPSRIGQVDPFSGILLGADVSLFGRNIFGNGIYPAGEFKIPAATRLSSAGADTEPAWGQAIFFPQGNKNELSALQISLATVAENLVVKRGAAGPEPEVIQVSLLTQLIGDPLFAIVGIFLAGVVLLGQFVVSIKEICK